jgi:hypothetical protein
MQALYLRRQLVFHYMSTTDRVERYAPSVLELWRLIIPQLNILTVNLFPKLEKPSLQRNKSFITNVKSVTFPRKICFKNEA